MAHTNGPWTISEPWSGFSSINGPEGELVFGLAAGAADEKRSDEECEANARLIAAAPDFLQALRSARARLATVFEAEGRDPRDDATVREIDAAIEKATGP